MFFPERSMLERTSSDEFIEGINDQGAAKLHAILCIRWFNAVARWKFKAYRLFLSFVFSKLPFYNDPVAIA